MSKVAVPIDQISNGSVPPVCLICGEHADHKYFPDIVNVRPPGTSNWPHLPLFSLLGFWFLIFRKSLVEQPHQTGLPFCPRHRGYWPRRARFIIGGFLVLPVVIAFQAAVSSDSSGPGITGIVMVLWFFLFLPAFLIVHLASVRPIDNSNNTLVLSSANRKFIESLGLASHQNRDRFSGASRSSWSGSRPAGAEGVSGTSLLMYLRIALIIGAALFAIIHGLERAQPPARPQSPQPVSFSQSIPITLRSIPVAARPAMPASTRKAVGTFISAPDRTDMVHDPKRNLLYITADDSVLRYDVKSNAFLTPLVLGGHLRGIDLSLNNDSLAVADALTTNNNIWFHLVNLTTGADSRVTFPADRQEAGTFSLAFGADGGVWITSSFHGSGWVPLRKYSPSTRSTLVLRTISQDTMLSASADRQTIAFAQANSSPGQFGQFKCSATQLPPLHEVPGFLFEIGIDRRGTQLAVPSYSKLFLLGSPTDSLSESSVIGAVYHPTRDFLFIARSGTSTITGFETTDYQKVKELEFGQDFKSVGNHAFQEGRLRMSQDGSLLFCTVNGGVRYAQTGL
jgi:hypothetical protein